MSRMTNLELLVEYEDELTAMRKAGEWDSDRAKQLEEQIKELRDSMPKYRPHVYQDIRDNKYKGKGLK